MGFCYTRRQLVDQIPSRFPTHNPQFGDGKYKIIRRLAVGGMAEIYLAEAANIHGFRKKVVIKRILPQYANQSAYVEMFLDEARLAARLNHASIVQVFDIGQDPEGVFFTMEYVEGRDLAEILGACYKLKRQLKLEEVLAVLMPSAEALHHAHELRDDNNQLCHLIHRDVSPSNILVTNEGRVKLLDFGVAKSNDQQRETTGVSLKGKFGYMSPEQVKGLRLDRRGDIFSFGVVLWELCTGRRLYTGGNDPSVLLKIINEQAQPPSTHRPDVPPQLDHICLRALSRNRDQRYSTMKELIHDLDDFATHNGIVTNSRTLSRMLDDVFPESTTTEASPTGSPLEQSQHQLLQTLPPVYASEPHAAPLLGSTEPSYPSSNGYQPPSYGSDSFVEKPAQKKRWPVLLAGGFLVAAGVAIAILGGAESTEEARAPDVAKPMEGEGPEPVDAPALVEGDSVADEAVDATGDTGTDTALVDSAAGTPASEGKPAADLSTPTEDSAAVAQGDEGENTDDTKPEEVDTTLATKKPRSAKGRKKSSKSQKGKNTSTRDKKPKSNETLVPETDVEEEWNSNSPFAPE